jgi:hypothetical protein
MKPDSTALLSQANAFFYAGDLEKAAELARAILDNVFNYNESGSYNRLKESLQSCSEGEPAFNLLVSCLRAAGEREGWINDPTAIPRGGLSRARAMLSSRAQVIAYLGASVSAQRDSFVPLLHRRLCSLTGQNHEARVVARGATGSMYALETLEDDILRHRPAICFIEYLTGDLNEGLTPWSEMESALEFLVMRMLEAGCAVVFLHLFRGDYLLNRENRALGVYEAVAERFNIPSIHAGRFLQRLILEGGIGYFDLIRDAVHTTALGSELASRFTASRVSEFFWTRENNPFAKILRPRDRCFADVRLHRPGERYSRFIRTWKDKLFVNLGPELSEIEWNVSGYLLGVSVIVGPQSGAIQIVSADEVRTEVMWDHWCRSGGDRFRLIPVGKYFSELTRLVIRLKLYPVLPCGFCKEVDARGEVRDRHAKHKQEFIIRYECPCGEVLNVGSAQRTAAIVGLVVMDVS